MPKYNVVYRKSVELLFFAKVEASSKEEAQILVQDDAEEMRKVFAPDIAGWVIDPLIGASVPEIDSCFEDELADSSRQPSCDYCPPHPSVLEMTEDERTERIISIMEQNELDSEGDLGAGIPF